MAFMPFSVTQYALSRFYNHFITRRKRNSDIHELTNDHLSMQDLKLEESTDYIVHPLLG